MNKLVEEIKKVHVFYIATMDGDQPRVRPFGSVTEFEGNCYICTGNFKDVYNQIMKNPKVELSGMYDNMSWLRVSATLELDNRYEVQDKILKDPTGPKGLYTPLDGKFATFKMTNIVAKKYSFVTEPEEITE